MRPTLLTLALLGLVPSSAPAAQATDAARPPPAAKAPAPAKAKTTVKAPAPAKSALPGKPVPLAMPAAAATKAPVSPTAAPGKPMPVAPAAVVPPPKPAAVTPAPAAPAASAVPPKSPPPAAPAAPAPVVVAPPVSPAPPAPPPAIAPPVPAPAAPVARPKVAISEFVVEGDQTSPALSLRLQDGFVLGLARAGLDVLDPVELQRTLDAAPELQKCEASPCLKRIGERLNTRFLVRVRVQVVGNSYRMSARLFSTEGAAPAALPVASQTRACEVCTVAEAREQMVDLADRIRRPIEATPVAPRPITPVAPPPPSLVAPMMGAAAGAAVTLLGLVILDSADDGKALPFVAGAMVAGGLATTGVSAYVALDRRRSAAKPTPTVSLAWRF